MSNDPFLRDLINQSLGLGAQEAAGLPPEPVLPPEQPVLPPEPAPVDPYAPEPVVAAPPEPVVAPAPITPAEGYQQQAARGNEAFEAAQAAGEKQVAGLEAQGEAVKQATDAQVAVDEQTRRDDAELAEAAAASERITQEVHQRSIDNLRAREQEIANTPIDSDRLWNSKSAPQKIAGIFAAMASGFMAPHTGGRNLFLEQLDKEIDRDVQLQRADRNAQLQSLGRERADLDQQLTLDRQQDILDLGTKKAKKQAALNKLLSLQTQVQGTQQEAVVQQHIGELQRSIARDEQAQAAKLQDQYAKQDIANKKLALEQKKLELKARKKAGSGTGRGATRVGATTPGMRILDPKTGQQIDMSKFEAGGTDRGRIDNGTVSGGFVMERRDGTDAGSDGIFVGSPEQAKEFSKLVRNGRRSVGQAARLLKLLPGDAGSGGIAVGELSTGDAARIRGQWVEMAMQLKESYNLGVLTGPDMGLIMDATGGDPTKLTGAILNKVSLNHVRSVLENMVGGRNELMQNELLAAAGVRDPENYTIRLTPYTIGGDLDEQAAAEAAAKKKTAVADSEKNILAVNKLDRRANKGAYDAEVKSASSELRNLYSEALQPLKRGIDTDQSEGERAEQFGAKEVQDAVKTFGNVAAKAKDPKVKSLALSLKKKLEAKMKETEEKDSGGGGLFQQLAGDIKKTIK